MQNYSRLNPQDDVIVYSEGATLPGDIQIIGKTEIGDSGFTTNCGLDVVIEKAKNEARKIGANAIVITQHVLPSVWGSSCHRIKADLVKTGVQTNGTQNSVQTETLTKNNAVVSYESKNVKSPSNYNKFLVSFNYGLGYRTAGVEKGTPAIEKDFQNELRSGNSFQIKTGYKPNQNAYYGLIYSKFSSSTSLNNVVFVEPSGFAGSGSTSQNNTINYVGLVAGWTLNGFLKNDVFNFDMSLGYINFSEERKFENTYTAKGGNLGISTDLSYYFGVSKYFKIGPTFSFSGGAIKKYKVSSNNGFSDTVEFDENTFLSLYRVDLMLGTYFEF
jgi:hypothetical protein